MQAMDDGGTLFIIMLYVLYPFEPEWDEEDSKQRPQL